MTVFRAEPQGVLGLSWFAVILTALDIMFTSDVRKEQDSDTSEVIEKCSKCGK